MKEAKTLYIVIPCYNEEKVLPITAPMFLEELNKMISENLVSENSRILFVDDGSSDSTWSIMQELSSRSSRFAAIRQSRNRGHQNALFAGLMEARELCDMAVSADCDGQDDISAIEKMVRAHLAGAEVVYGVRSSRKKDTLFKRTTALAFYGFMKKMGADIVYNHADYRLLSKRVLDELSGFREVNLFLRGMVPLIGFSSACVYYERNERLAGESHYPLAKMAAFALDGITSLSTVPLDLIFRLGALLTAAGAIFAVCCLIRLLLGKIVTTLVGILCIALLVLGVQLLCLGCIGEYVGKIYMEVKDRPRYIISERTGLPKSDAQSERPDSVTKKFCSESTLEAQHLTS